MVSSRVPVRRNQRVKDLPISISAEARRRCGEKPTPMRRFARGEIAQDFRANDSMTVYNAA
jgi:hypothetical protein